MSKVSFDVEIKCGNCGGLIGYSKEKAVLLCIRCKPNVVFNENLFTHLLDVAMKAMMYNETYLRQEGHEYCVNMLKIADYDKRHEIVNATMIYLKAHLHHSMRR